MAQYFRTIGARGAYEYDFGDSWVHQIELEAVGRRQRGARYPRCLGGERACPPEDCGGPGGYAQLLATVRDPSHEEHVSTLEWLGGTFDPDAFVPGQVHFDDPKKRWRIAFS